MSQLSASRSEQTIRVGWAGLEGVPGGVTPRSDLLMGWKAATHTLSQARPGSAPTFGLCVHWRQHSSSSLARDRCPAAADTEWGCTASGRGQLVGHRCLSRLLADGLPPPATGGGGLSALLTHLALGALRPGSAEGLGQPGPRCPASSQDAASRRVPIWTASAHTLCET